MTDLILASPLLDSTSLMKGKHFTIGTIKLLPFIDYKNISSDRHIHEVSGFIYEVVLYIATKYHFNFDFIVPRDSFYGSEDANGTWNGLMGTLTRKEFDLVAGGMVVTYPRFRAVDFSVQFYNDPVSILIPYPTLDDAINGITRPFQYDVWIYIIISLFGTTFALWILYLMELRAFDKRRKIPQLTLYESFWSLLDFDFVEMDIENSSRLPIRILATVWCLMSFVLVNAYSSTLTAYLMTPRYHPIINSIEDIPSMPRPVFMVSRFTSYETILMDATEGTLAKVGDSLRKNPELRLTSRPNAIDYIIKDIIKDKKSFTTLRSRLLYVMEQDYKQTNQCRIYLAQQPWDIARMALMLQKYSPLTPYFNRQINWLRDVGLLDYWERRNWPQKNRCSEPLPTSLGSETRLSMDALSSAFILLGCGLVAAIFTFLVEWAIQIYNTSKTPRSRVDTSRSRVD